MSEIMFYIRKYAKNLFAWSLVTLACVFIVLLFWRGMWVTLIEKHEFAFQFDKTNGKVTAINHQGYYIANPIFRSVHTIDLRPHQVQINNMGTTSTSDSDVNSRVLNAKLVRFNPAGLDIFISWHGRDAADSVENMLKILKIYAFDPEGGRDCPFLIVEKSLASTGVQTPAATPVQK